MSALASLQAIRAQVDGYFRWWWSELQCLMPSRWAAWSRTGRSVEIACKENGFEVSLQEPRGSGASQSQQRPTLAEALASGRSHADAGRAVRLVVEQHGYFRRLARIPRAAKHRAGEILDLDIERATPFVRDEVLSGWRVIDDRQGCHELAIEHVLLKRSRAAALVTAAGAAGFQRVHLACRKEDGVDIEIPLPRSLSPRKTALGRALHAVNLVSACAIALGPAAAVWLGFGTQQAALRELDSRLEIKESEARAVRATYEHALGLSKQVHLLGERRTGASVAELVEEITRALPDGAWLTDLEIDGPSVTLIGFARAAPGLIAALDGSGSFRDVSFASPVIRAPREDADRFIITMRIAAFDAAVRDQLE